MGGWQSLSLLKYAFANNLLFNTDQHGIPGEAFMHILLNGEKTSLEENTTPAMLVLQLGLNNKRLAMEVNRNILPRSEYEQYVFRDNDCVEVVQAIGGG